MILRAALVLGLALAGLALLAAGMSPPAMPQDSNASAQMPARIGVNIPPFAPGSARTLMMELAIRSVRNSDASNIAGVVRLSGPGGGKSVEVGRFSFFNSGGDEQRYQFNVTQALRQLDLASGQAEVEVAVIDRSNRTGSTGAVLVIGGAHIEVR
jgi:hypothetical protein